MEEIKQPQETGLTFKEVFNLLKCGRVMLAVTLIVSVLLSVAVLVIAREGLGSTSYETEITFSSASISEENEFNPSTTTNTLLKSNAVVTAALEKCGYSNEEQQNLLKSGLVSELSAYTAVETTSTNGVTYPYVVKLSLKKTNKFKLSKAQATELIEELTKQVIAELVKEYKYDIELNQLVAFDYTQYNYLQVFEAIDKELDAISVFGNAISNTASNYKVNGNSIKMKLAEMELVRNELNTIRLELIKNVYTDEANTKEEDTAVFNATYYSQKVQDLEARITEFITVLEKAKANVTITSAGISVDSVDSNMYKLVEQYNKLSEERSLMQTKEKEWEEFKTAYSGTTPTSSESIKVQFNNLIEKYNKIVGEMNSILTTYNEDVYFSSLVSMTRAANTTKESPVSIMIIVVVELVVICMSCLVVFLIEKKKSPKQKVVEKAE